VSAFELPAASAAATDGWTDDTAATWTYVSATTFTVTGDRTAVFSKGTRLKLTQTTVKYFVVVASLHAAGTTTVTITGGTDYTLANAAISANSYSYAANPQGYPGYFNYTPTLTGWSADPGVTLAKFAVVGNQCWITIATNVGTSNATSVSCTLPITCVTAQVVPCRGQDNGVNMTAPAKFNFPAASATATANKDLANASWTASGNKFFQVQGFYDI